MKSTTHGKTRSWPSGMTAPPSPTPAEQADDTGLTSAAANSARPPKPLPPGAIRDLRNPDAADEDND